eukprot:Gb_31426 [translate_table: standard]
MHVSHSPYFTNCLTGYLMWHEGSRNNPKNMTASVVNRLRNQPHKPNASSTVYKVYSSFYQFLS